MTSVEQSVSSGEDVSYVLIVGQEPTQSSPALTLAKALAGLGVAVRFVHIDELGRMDWFGIFRRARAVVLVSYLVVGEYRLSQLATAVALNVPLVRWWVGTDVLNALANDKIRQSAASLDRIVAANICVAPHLVEELAGIKIHAQFVPSVLDPALVPSGVVPWVRELKPILIYMPTERKEFYGLRTIEPVIAANPDLTFMIMADESHALASYSNVESLGWVTDMNEVYARAGCVLRITEHDGLPRMLLEALLHGLYAIYAWPLSGCWEARTTDEINKALSRYRTVTQPNIAGREAILEMLMASPEREWEGVIARTVVPIAVRARGVFLAVRLILFGRRIDSPSG